MKKKLLISLSLICIFLLAVTTFLFINSQISSGRDREEKIALLLKDADQAVSLGYLDQAANNIAIALRSANSEYEYLRVLKRSLKLTNMSGDFQDFEGQAAQALASIPGSSSLQTLMLYGKLRSGQSHSLNISDPAKKKIPLSLWAEAVQRNRVEIDFPDDLPEELKQLLLLEKNKNSGILLDLGKKQADKRLLLDAALSLMKEGNGEAAMEVIEQYLVEEIYDEPVALIAYDQGNMDESIFRLERLVKKYPQRKDLILLLADNNLLAGNYNSAAKIYQQFIQMDYHYSWKPYLNLAWINELQNNPEREHSFKVIAALRYPEKKQVLLELVRSYKKRGEIKEAKEALQKLHDLDPQELETLLLGLELAGTSFSPSLHRSKLWQLYNLFPDNENLCKALAAYLLELGDIAGAAMALDQFTERFGGEVGPLWHLHLQGIIKALEGDYPEAAARLKSYLERKDSWQVRYNLGLILKNSAQYEEAIRELRQADILLGRETANRAQDHFRSLTRTELGSIFLADGDYEAAARELGYARELDANNLKASLLYNKLEEIRQK
ncbi:MAG TPA: tetratricopeptide repeat protein [Spirochaetales bacterium]|nr:tetratricopeptide repeat protein [Spirochaetales bacterium]